MTEADAIFTQPVAGPVQAGTQPDLFERLLAWWRRFVFTVAAADYDLLVLWTVHTHVAEECYTSPRLQLDSPMPGSGKTTVLEHLARLARSAITMASVSSPALLTRLLDKESRTILIDEADRSLSPDKPGVDELLAVINSGYKRGATRPVLVPVKGGGWDAAEMPTFAPVALAGNNPHLPEDTRSRIIRVLLLPDLDGTADESDWELIDDEAAELAEEIRDWAEAHRDQIRTLRPTLPNGITGRFREKWGPLARIAAIVGGRWPATVAAMALQDKEQFEMDKEDGLVRERPAILLLRDLREIWPDGETFVPTNDLLPRLIALHPDVWGDSGPFGKELTAKRLARMLAASYKVNSTRIANTGPRGYLTAALEPAWQSMGMAAPHPNDPVNVAEAVNPVAESPRSPDEPRSPRPPEVLPGLDAGNAGNDSQPAPASTARTWFCEQCGAEVPPHNVLCRTCVAAVMGRARAAS